MYVRIKFGVRILVEVLKCVGKYGGGGGGLKKNRGGAVV